MIANCPVCGKCFDVLWPHLWRYKRNTAYLCSWKCIRLFDRKGDVTMKETEGNKRARMKPEDMEEAVRLYKENDPGLDQFLTDHGVTNVKKWRTNAKARYGAPEITVATVKIDGPIRIETPETNKLEVVETPERQIGGLCPLPEVEDDRLFHTAAVRSKKLGTFYYDDKHGTIDWRHPYGEEISLFPEDYRLLRDSIDMILRVLGV